MGPCGPFFHPLGVFLPLIILLFKLLAMKKTYLIVVLEQLTFGHKVFSVLSEVARCDTTDQAQTELAHWAKVHPKKTFSIITTYKHSTFAG